MLKLGNIESKYPWMTVVGVVQNQAQGFSMLPELGVDTSDVIFLSAPDSSSQSHRFVIRSTAGASEVRLAVNRAIHDMLPRGSDVAIEPWAARYNTAVREEEFLALVFTLLGAASLALGAAGLFSVVSYIAGQRMREYAVRVALGATRQNLARLIFSEALAMALGGTAVGAVLGMWGGFMLWDKMYGVYPVDATALIAAEATLLIISMLACLVPALRATRANPVDTLRGA
jgi:ABC-type antimicrobial peptide transport system permease subunit